MSQPDHYQTLQLSRHATQAEIKQAYRRLAKELHPDSQNAGASHDGIVQLNKAYEVLSDRDRRRAYDNAQQSYTAKRNDRAANAQKQYARYHAQDRDKQLMQWLDKVYHPCDRAIEQIIQPLRQQINDLAADPFDSDLMANFVEYIEACRDRLGTAQNTLRSHPNPSLVAGSAASLFYCLNHLEDALNEFEWFTNNYDENYLHTGQEFFRIANQFHREAHYKLPNI